MPTILDEIVARKRVAVDAARAAVSEAALEQRLAAAPPVRGFARALAGPGPVRVVAEVKQASPSAGTLSADFDPARLARQYAAGGAAAVSVLTDEPYFRGHLDHLRLARAAVPLPVLRKEFIVDRYQLLEARAAGADAVLLIAEVLPGDELRNLHAAAVGLGLDALVELHDAAELPRVLDTGATLVGVNNRDLRTFHTRLSHTLELRPRIPAGVTVVSESGVRTPLDVARLRDAGVHAVLVGEALVTAPDPAAAVRALAGG